MSDWWREFQRRNVFRVGAAYLAVAWLLIQLVDNLAAMLEAPSWVGRTTVVVVIACWPLVLMLAWLFEPGAAAQDAVPAARSPFRRKLNVTIIAALALAVGVLLAEKYLFVATPNASTEAAAAPTTTTAAGATTPTPTRDVLPNSVAVLPFANLSPDPNNAWFADGIHEEVISQLVKIRDLTVISRTSVLPYASAPRPIGEIATELRVQSVMEGTVRYADDRVKITVKLIDPATDGSLWVETYDGDLGDVFAVQTEIAKQIVSALRAELTSTERAQIERQPTGSTEAYLAYLRARQVGWTNRELGLQLADEAIAADPNFALAYVAKAFIYSVGLIDTGGAAALPRPMEQLEQLASEAVDHALAIDDNLGAAHLYRGVTDALFWRWKRSRESLDRAVELTPGDAELLRVAAMYLARFGDYERARNLIGRASELAPNDNQVFGSHWEVLALSGDHLAAKRFAERAIQANVNGAQPHLRLAFSQLALGEPAQAGSEATTAERSLADDIPSQLAQIAYVYSRAGLLSDATRVFRRIQQVGSVRPVGDGSWALAHLAAGNQADALEALSRAAEKIRKHEVDIGFLDVIAIRANLAIDPVLEQPEFVAARAALRPDE